MILKYHSSFIKGDRKPVYMEMKHGDGEEEKDPRGPKVVKDNQTSKHYTSSTLPFYFFLETFMQGGSKKKNRRTPIVQFWSPSNLAFMHAHYSQRVNLGD